MWISWLLGKSFWYTLYAVIESKPSGGSRRGARGTPYFWTKLRSEVPKKFFLVGDWVPLTKGLDDCPPPPLSPLISRSGFGTEAPLLLGPLTCLKCMVVPMAVLYFSGNVFGNNPEEVVGIRARFSLRSIFQWKLLSSSSLKESCLLIIFSYSTCRCYSQTQENCLQIK